MLPMLEINLDWPVASQYVTRKVRALKEANGAIALKAERGIYVAENATITLRRPLDENPSLYAEFAKLDGSEKACLNFAHRYGNLSADPRYPVASLALCERLSFWRAMIEDVRDIIRRCELSRDNPREAFRQFAKKDKSLFGVELSLSIKNSNSPATLEMRAQRLIAGMQLQAIQAVLLGGRKSVQCIECSRPFLIGGGARRSQSKFCSTRCKDSYHNRLKAQARRTDHA
jgi:hypothetical protein